MNTKEMIRKIAYAAVPDGSLLIEVDDTASPEIRKSLAAPQNEGALAIIRAKRLEFLLTLALSHVSGKPNLDELNHLNIIIFHYYRELAQGAFDTEEREKLAFECNVVKTRLKTLLH